MRHRKAVLLVAALLVTPFAAPAQTRDEDKDKEKARFKKGWQLASLSGGVADVRGLDEAAALEAIQTKLKAADGGKNLKAVGELFRKHPFAVVEKIAKAKGLSPADAQALGALRRRMIDEAMAKAMEVVDPKKTLTIGMLDSGNKASGIASDVDQTVFVIPKDRAKAAGVDEAKVIAEFEKQFLKLHEVKPERLGIESMNGADFFPDWRQAHTIDKVGTGANELGKEAEAFMREGDRVVAEKRKNPEAYRSEGQLKSQAEGRGYEALQQHHERVTALRDAKDAIQEIAQTPGLAEADRTARTAEVEAALLKKLEKDYPAKSIAELEEKLAKDSPWTEVGWGEDGKPATSRLEDPASRVLANKPELHERFAFDGAWDNWLMYEHHPHNRRKYLLRSVAEGVSLRRGGTGTALSTFEYEKVYGENTAEARAECKKFVDEVYKDLPDATREQFRKALDVAAKERLRHKGAKNPSTGKDYTLQEVWSEFWPALSEKEAKLYSDLPKPALEKLLQERAARTWDAVGRELMIENLARTIDAPAKLLGGGISDAEFARVKEKFPDATRAKLAVAVQRQLYHGLHDLMTIEHARELVATPEQKKTLAPRPKDLVDRLLEKVGGADSELGAQVRRIARLAAAKRIATDPGERKFRHEVYSYLKESLREFLSEKSEDVKDVRDSARAFYEEFKAGRITREVVARKLTIAAAERLALAKAEALHALGFDVKDVHLLMPEEGFPKVQVELGAAKWDPKKLLSHLANAGNVDSALSVVLAYQEGGAEAAAWAAGYELIMNVPGVAQANAVKDLVVHKRPEGVVMLGAAMFVPLAGEVFILVNIGKSSVTILGRAVLDPLKDDDADKMYQGFLDKSSGFKDVEKSKRPGLLHFVPIRVIPRTVAQADGKKVTTLVWRYSKADAEKIFSVTDTKEYDALVEAGVLGGGAEWNEAFASVRGDENARANFEARRASMYYHFGDAVKAKLAPKKLDPDDGEAFPLIVEHFKDYVDQWVNAKGAFAEFDENVTISRRFEDKTLREKIATRAASDFVYSWKLIRGSVIATTTIERSTEARIAQLRLEETAAEANGMIVALDEAWKAGVDPRLAGALEHELELRKQDARTRAPRFRARPRVTDDQLELLVSVVDGPREKELAPADAGYRVSVRYELSATASRNEVELTAYVTVTGAKTGEKIAPWAPAGSDTFSTTDKGELAIKVGKLARSGSLPESADLKVAYTLKGTPAAVGTPATVYENLVAEKASARGDRWGGREVGSFAAQVWVCWEKAPEGASFEYELVVTGGAAGKYEKREEGPVAPRDRFPDQAEPSGRENVFVLPFAWPEGEVGSFTLKATIQASVDGKPGEHFEVTRTFAIPDTRLMDSSKLVLRFARTVTVAEIAALDLDAEDKERYTKYAQGAGGKWTIQELYEPFDSSRADLWLKKWEGHPEATDSQFKPQVHVRWKDVPPDALYFYEVVLSGGVPARDVPEEGEITPRDDFPPAKYKSGKGSSAFLINVPWPFYRGGSFVVSGKIHAVAKDPYPADWRKAKSLGTLPFEQRFTLANKCRFTKGNVRVSDDSMVYLQLLFAEVQEGRRLVKVDAGGKTAYYLLDERYYGGGFFPDRPHNSHWATMNMPYGTKPPTEATVTFVDFGETVTETIKLVPEPNQGDVERFKKSVAENEKKSLEKIAGWKKNEEVNLDPIAREYDDLASGVQHIDRAKWKEYAKRAEECWDRLRERARKSARNEDDLRYVREAVASHATRFYASAVEWGDAGEAESEFAAAVAKIQGSGLAQGDIDGRLAGLHGYHADNVVKLTGDLARATELWKKAVELGKSGTGYRPSEKCPYEVDASFR